MRDTILDRSKIDAKLVLNHIEDSSFHTVERYRSKSGTVEERNRWPAVRHKDKDAEHSYGHVTRSQRSEKKRKRKRPLTKGLPAGTLCMKNT